jgi:hypothetical protein
MKRGRPKTDYSEPFMLKIWEQVIRELYRRDNPAMKKNGVPCVSKACRRIALRGRTSGGIKREQDRSIRLVRKNETGFEIIQLIESEAVLRRRFYAALDAYKQPEKYPILHQRINILKHYYLETLGVEIPDTF